MPSTSETVTVTPEIAQKWLDEKQLSGQRRITWNTVETYAKQMLSGEWKEGSAISQSINGEHTWLTNGQHRLHAVIVAQKPQVFTLISRYEDEEAARHSYQIEDNQKRRTPLDSIRVLGLSEKLNICETDLNFMVAGCIIVNEKFKISRSYAPPSLRERLIYEWADYFRAYMACYMSDGGNKKSDDLSIYRAAMRAVVIACGLYTFRYQPDIAGSFWKSVFYPSTISAISPEFKLREFLISENTNGNEGRKRHLSVIARTWNAAYDGRTLARLVPGADLPTPLFAGCPNPKA